MKVTYFHIAEEERLAEFSTKMDSKTPSSKDTLLNLGTTYKILAAKNDLPRWAQGPKMIFWEIN